MDSTDLIIIEKYEVVANYLYPILQNMPRRHSVLRDRVLDVVFAQTELFYVAVKSNSKSKLYEADANLASLRFYLRFLADNKRRLISKKQQQVAEIAISEVGRILNSWIKK